MTTANSKFQGDLNSVLDLIYRTYKIQPHYLTKPFEDGIIAIYFDDLKEYSLEPDKFLKHYFYLENEITGMELISGYDEDALIYWSNVGDLTIPEPPVCKIKLPDSFEDSYKVLVNSQNKNYVEKVIIYYSNIKGLYHKKDGIELAYGITGHLRPKIVEALIKNPNIPIKADTLGGHQVVSAAVKELNRLIKDKLDINNFILNTGKGYFIDTEKYEVFKVDI